MKILLVSDFFAPVRGGLESHVGDLASALAARGHEVHLATLTHVPTPPTGVNVHTVRQAGNRVLRHADPSRPFHPPVPDPLTRRDLTRLVEALQPDVIHSHSWLVSSLPSSARPLVHTAHDYALVCQLRTLQRPNNVHCSGPGPVCLPCGGDAMSWPKSAALATTTFLGRRFFRPVELIALSHYVRQLLQPRVHVPITVIPGFLPPAGPAQVQRPPGVPAGRYLMYAGDPGTHKGLDVLLRMWNDWKPENLSLLIATTKPLSGQFGGSVRVVHLARDDMAAAWRHAEVAVVPSVWQEPFGMVAIEALAAGAPVVATRVGGLTEIVKDGVDGLLVPPGDPTTLRHAVQEITGDPARRQRMSVAASAAADRYSISEAVPRIEAIYHRISSN